MRLLNNFRGFARHWCSFNDAPPARVSNPRGYKFRKRRCLALTSCTFFFMMAFTILLPRQIIYVLEAGFPLIRYAETSSQFAPSDQSKTFSSNYLEHIIPWSATHTWTPIARATRDGITEREEINMHDKDENHVKLPKITRKHRKRKDEIAIRQNENSKDDIAIRPNWNRRDEIRSQYPYTGGISLQDRSYGDIFQVRKEEDEIYGAVHNYPNCAKLIAGDSATELENAKSFMAQHSRFERTDDVYIRETENCARFVQERGYIMEATEEERDFPLAFSLLFYKDLEQAERLLRAVYRPHNVYCLHLDLKSPPSTLQATRAVASCLPNVFVSSRSVDVQWGTFSVLEPELICMNDMWNNTSWRYFINLTGQEFPLKTNLQMVQILKSLNGANDVDCTTNPRYADRWFNNFAAPHGIQPYKGNVHIAASRAMVDFVLHSPVAQDFAQWTKLTDVPDETFFSSLNHNPRLGVPGSYLGPPNTDSWLKPYLSRYKNWGHNWRDGEDRMNFNWPCEGKRVRTICIFGLGDLPALTARKELVANKLHFGFEPLTLECLEEWLWNMTMDEYSGRAELNLTFYEGLDVAHNHVDYVMIDNDAVLCKLYANY